MRLLKTSAAISGLLLAGSSFAGGLYFSETGLPSHGASSAGAGVLTDDAGTAWTNPAGINKLEESGFIASAFVLATEVQFKQDRRNTTVPGTNGGDAGSVIPAGSFHYANPLGDSRWGLGFSIGSFSGNALDHDEEFVGRYWVQELELLTLVAAPSIAYRISDDFSIGGGVTVLFARFDQDLAAPIQVRPGGPGQGPQPIPPGNEPQVSIEDGEDTQIQFNVGFLWDMDDKTRLGMRYISGFTAEFDSDLKLDAGIDPNTFDGTVELPFAQQIRLNASRELTDNVKLLFQLAWEDWSELDKAVLSVNNISGELDYNWDDVYRVALGVQIKEAGSNRTWMTGVAYDTDPSRPEDRRADLPVDSQFRVSAGVTWDLPSGNRFGTVVGYADLGNNRIQNGGTFLSGQPWEVSGSYDASWWSFGFNYAW